MNKLEEKFKKVIPIHVTQRETEESMSIKRNLAIDAAKQCVEITEQECIGFAEWINIESYICSTNELWYQMSDGITDDGITTQTLFQLYLKSKENE